MKKRRLLLLVPSLQQGGRERVAVNTAKILEAQYEITMVVFTLTGAVYDAPCHIIDLNIPDQNSRIKQLFKMLQRVRGLKKIKQELKIDATYSFGKTANIANVLSRVSDRIIVSVHGYRYFSKSIIGKIFNYIVFWKADTVVCVAKKMMTDMLAQYHISESKVVVLYNPYDLDNITELANAPIDYAIRHPAIATMGRLEEVKGYRHLLKTFSLVHNQLPEATLLFIGEGNKRGALEKLVLDLNLESHVVFLGFQKNPFRYIAEADVFVLSSINEGFPNALVEAMACSIPVVATDCKSGPREILTEVYSDVVMKELQYADYGILTPPFSSDYSDEPDQERLLAEAIITVLNDNDLNKHFRLKVKERARVFSFDAYKRSIIRTIEGVR